LHRDAVDERYRGRSLAADAVAKSLDDAATAGADDARARAAALEQPDADALTAAAERVAGEIDGERLLGVPA
jgi:hypothetical protein